MCVILPGVHPSRGCAPEYSAAEAVPKAAKRELIDGVHARRLVNPPPLDFPVA